MSSRAGAWLGPAVVVLFAVGAAGAEEPAPAPEPPKTRFSGDFRLRYENTTFAGGEPDRNRGTLRLRVALDHSINDLIAVGARVATGAREDPRSSDATLGDFAKDLELSLDRAFVRLAHGGLALVGGRFANPLLRRSEIVWDDDVNPQGLAGSLRLEATDALDLQLTGLLFLIDEQAAGPDSSMGGGQLAALLEPSNRWRLTLAIAYQDYGIESLQNAGDANVRGNYLDASGTAYLSDFDLLEAFLDVEFLGLGARLPLGLTADWVRNLGAAVPEDDGYALELVAGRLQQRGDVRGRYGYARVERDAVLGTFSHDNIPLATGYEMHTLAADWEPLPHTFLNLTWYLYRSRAAADDGGAMDETSYQSRLRLHASVAF